MRGAGRGATSEGSPLEDVATANGFGRFLSVLTCTCGRADDRVRELLGEAVFWKGQAKTAIRVRDQLDKTLLSMDGGIGHWRRMSKELSAQLNVARQEAKALTSPGLYRRPSSRQLDDMAQRAAAVITAAAEREEDVERRVTRARDLLYGLKRTVGVDTPIGQDIHKAWETL
jgi:hypothetical protein